MATTALDAVHGASQIARVVDDATSATQPARKAGQISLTLSSVQPGSALHATAAYFAGSVGAVGGAGAGAEAAGGAVATGGRGGVPEAGGARGPVAQPVTISSATPAQASRVTSKRGEAGKMVWFILEALVALLIAVAIVAWTMGLKRRTPPRTKPGDADRDNKP